MRKNIYYFSPIKGIVGIKTNRKDFSFSYGLAMPFSTEETYNDSLIKIDLSVIPKGVVSNLEDRSTMGKFHYFSGINNNAEIFYDRNFIFNRKFQFKISGIDSNHIRAIVNANYFKYVKHRFMNIHSIGYILTDIINLRLLHNKFAPLHCSSFAYGGNGYVIFAPPNTGKTLTAMTICMEDNDRYRFIAEDLAITDGENVYSVPWTSTFRYYDSVDSSFFSRFLNKLTEKIPVLELFSFGKTESVTKYTENITHQSKIKGIYILDRGTDFIKSISNDDAFDRINTLDRYEFNYMRAPAIIAYEYFNRATDIEKAYNEERNLLKKMIANAEFVKVVSCDDALKYPDFIKNDL